MLGSTSGATDVAVVFNTPFVGVNYAPFMESPLGGNDIFIQKKVVNSEGHTIPYKDIISESKYYLYDGNKFKNLYGMNYLDNSADEILEVTKEMHNIQSKNLKLNSSQRILLDRYHNEYCQKNNWSKRYTPISIKWLEKNYSLYLNDDED